ncbi:MAG TPA: peptidoglycan-binding protein [Bryobacteraceae bacterium]|jgi:N-acetylmuramoyl-L-alanine amidase
MNANDSNGVNSNDSNGPVGTGNYVVKEGDCIGSLAYEHRLYWETILNHPDNREVKKTRENYHILLPGDRLTIPPIREKQLPAATDMHHNYVWKGASEKFQLRLLNLDDTPRANVPYRLVVGMNTYEGETDENGELKQWIPANAKGGRLIVGVNGDAEEVELSMGDLDPAQTVTGAQARLTNLGFSCGAIDGIAGPKTCKAIKRFQKAHKLEQTGALDDATVQALQERHGS